MVTIETNPQLGEQVREDAKRYVLHSWSVQDAVDPIAVAGAEGRYFWDYDGKRYLDFASQLVNVSIGHQHPKIVAAIKEQAEKLCTIGPPMATEPRSTLARMLAEITPGDLTMSFFTNGGAEANENAIKLARWYTGRHKVIARYRSYHGATAGAITLTGDPRRWPAEPAIPGVVRMLDPYTYRCPAGHPDPCPVCSGAPHLEEILQYEGPHTVAAVILEPVTGTNGIIVPPDGYLRSIREVCDRHGGPGGAAGTRRAAPIDRRRARARLLLGPRARALARNARAARALQRYRRGGGADDAAGKGGARPRPLPDDPLERDHDLPPAHDHPRGARRRHRDPRRRPGDRRRVLHRLS